MSSQGFTGRSLATVLLMACVTSSACTSQTNTPGAEEVRRPVAPEAPATSATDVARRTHRDQLPQGATTHCAPGEHAIFSCVLEGSGRVVSLCMTRADGRHGKTASRYLAGPLGRPDVVLVEGAPPDVPVQFERTPLTFAGGTGGYAFSVGQGDEVHVLYSISGENQLERRGVMRTDTNVERVLADQSCETASIIETESVDALRAIRAWPTHPRLETSGLPPGEH